MTSVNRPDEQFRCCFYLHVRTGTVILGVLHMLLQLIVVSTLLVAALKQDIVALKSPYNVIGVSNCHTKKPPSDMLYMMMHVVPGFTIFHKSHSDFSTRLRDGKTEGTDLLEQPARQSGDSDSIWNFFKTAPSAFSADAAQQTIKAKADPSSLEVTTTASSNFIDADDVGSQQPSKNIEKTSDDESGLSSLTVDNTGSGNRSLRCLERHANPYFSLCLALLSLAFGYLLVHGVISRQPVHLLPFFCLQVFDFVVALICMLGYMSSAATIGHWLKDKINKSPNFKDYPITLNPTSVALIVISTSCLVLAFKAYCIGMVWDCHRYLLLTNRHGQMASFPSGTIPRFPFFWSGIFSRISRGTHLPIQQTREGFIGDGNSRDSTGIFVGAVPTEPPADSALPKYEEALSTPANAYAPPPYFVKSSKSVEEKQASEGK